MCAGNDRILRTSKIFYSVGAADGAATQRAALPPDSSKHEISTVNNPLQQLIVTYALTPQTPSAVQGNSRSTDAELAEESVEASVGISTRVRIYASIRVPA